MKSRAMAYSLIDFTRLYEFGKQNDEFALRDWHAYDSAPLVDAETDTLIYPGENGILYTIKLNTKFDETTGELSMNPSYIVKMRYAATRSTYPNSNNTSDNKYWLGYETSIATLGRIRVSRHERRVFAVHQPQHDVRRLGAGHQGRYKRFARARNGFCQSRRRISTLVPSLHFTADNG